MRLFHRSRSRTSGTATLAEPRRKSSRLRRGGGCTSAIFFPLAVNKTCCPRMLRGRGEKWAGPRRKGCVPPCQPCWLPAACRRSREARPRGSRARPRFRTSRNADAKTQLILRLEVFYRGDVGWNMKPGPTWPPRCDAHKRFTGIRSMFNSNMYCNVVYTCTQGVFLIFFVNTCFSFAQWYWTNWNCKEQMQ